MKKKSKLLLDVCCGPCSTHVIEELIDTKAYEITLIFPNDNIYPEEEYKNRLEQTKKISKVHNLNLIILNYDHDSWKNFIKGLELEPEKGGRCAKCFEYRLRKTAQYAKENNFEIFTTTLTVSPHKDSELINKIGKSIANDLNTNFLESNFKKKDGYKKSKLLSEKYCLYRQVYCGCEFSMRK